ncbi:MAG TPA: hypothetical protein VHX59_25295 [Mycobacteriales bacterium]|nr:hypothetical protein [Mycobacteriales bacterium]
MTPATPRRTPVDVARDVALGAAGPGELRRVLRAATTYCERGARPGFEALGRPGAGAICTFTSPEQLAFARGTVPWFSLPGGDLLDLLPAGYDLLLDLGGEAPLRLTTAAPYVDGAGQCSTALRYGAAHHVGFADGTNSSTSWESWIGSGESRSSGQVTGELLAALGLGVLTVADTELRRSCDRRTAMSAIGADPAISTATPQSTRSGAMGGISAELQGGRLRTPGAWRTNLAHAPMSGASGSSRASSPIPSPRSTADSPLVLDAASAIRHRGAPESVAGN